MAQQWPSLIIYNYPMTITQAIDWRYGAKKLDPTKKIPEEKIKIILEAARKAPSSNNFQPWKIIVVEDRELLVELQPAANNQEKVGQASHLIVLASLKKLDQEYIDYLVKITAEKRNLPLESLEGYRNSLSRSLNKTPEAWAAWAKQQTFISLGFLLLAAAAEEVDAGPMGGFKPAEVDRILGLDKTNYGSAVLVALGYRDEADKYAKLPKVRWSADEVIDRR